MQEQPKFQLVEFQPEENKVIEEKLKTVLSEHNAQFYIHQFINKGIIEANLQVLKKVELVPKDGIPSPFAGESSEAA